MFTIIRQLILSSVLLTSSVSVWAIYISPLEPLTASSLPGTFTFSAELFKQDKLVRKAFIPLENELKRLHRQCDENISERSVEYFMSMLNIDERIDKNTPEAAEAQKIKQHMDFIHSDQSKKCGKISAYGTNLEQEKASILRELRLAPDGVLNETQYQKLVSDALNLIEARMKKHISYFNDSRAAWKMMEQKHLNRLEELAAVFDEKKEKLRQQKESLEKKSKLKAQRLEKYQRLLTLIKGSEAERISAELLAADSWHSGFLKQLALPSEQNIHSMVEQALQLVREGEAFDPFVESLAAGLMPYWQGQAGNWLTVDALNDEDAKNLRIGEIMLFALIALIEGDGRNVSVLLSNPR